MGVHVGAEEVASRRGLVPLLLAIVPFSQIPLDAYTPAMPDMVRELATTSALVQNTVTSYMLGMCLALIPMGMLADAFGRKRVLLFGMAVLILASVACALATNIGVLIAVRFIQGVGACACLVISYAIAADCYRGKQLVALAGMLGVAWGLAPVLAPAAGGILVQFASWRVVFGAIALLAMLVALAVAFCLPETLPRERRAPIHLGETAGVLGNALGNLRFLSYTVVFALMASVQLVFGVVAPFLYQQKLGFSPAAYGLVALVLGGANLAGELACGTLGARISSRHLCFGAWAVFACGAVLLAATGTFGMVTFLALTLGGALTLAGCGTLCPAMYGMALGLFSKNLGLLGGLVSSLCYLTVSAAMALAAYLPETSQAPLGWMYVGLGLVAALVLLRALPVEKIPSQ